MRVIGVGLPRTGTLSQKVALEMLGFGPCYHMVSVLGDLAQVRLWERALAGAGPWEQIFAGYQATVDLPGVFFYRQLIDVYPDAKVVLSVRDPARWEQSMRGTILRVHRGGHLIHHLSAARGRIDPEWAAYTAFTSRLLWDDGGMFARSEAEHGCLTGQMQRYNDEVKATVPPDRLLVWEPADGWGPLCDFLDVPVPGQPFPHINDGAMFEDRVIEGSLAVLNAYWEERAARL